MLATTNQIPTIEPGIPIKGFSSANMTPHIIVIIPNPSHNFSDPLPEFSILFNVKYFFVDLKIELFFISRIPLKFYFLFVHFESRNLKAF